MREESNKDTDDITQSGIESSPIMLIKRIYLRSLQNLVGEKREKMVSFVLENP